MSTLHGSWIWYELMSANPEAASGFYNAVVGWNMSAGTADTADYGFIANPDGGMTGGVLRLAPAMLAEGAQPGWLGYLGVDDVDAMLPRIAAAGGTCLMPATDVAMAGRIAMVADCCGTPFYIMTPTPPPGGGESTAFSPTLPGRCSWNELQAGNAEHAAKFYSDLFGWTLPEPMDMGPLGKYQFLAHDGVTFGAMVQCHPDMPDHRWNRYFRVSSVGAARTAILAHHGTMLIEPHQVPGGDWIVQARDPEGVFFCLVGGA